MMKINIEEIIDDLNILIDISCLEKANVKLFKEFHNSLISLAYKATDVEIEYGRKRIYMNVLLEEVKGDYLIRYDDSTLRGMSTNLYYSQLKHFLKLCVKDEAYVVENYTTLKAKFLEAKAAHKVDFKNFEKVV